MSSIYSRRFVSCFIDTSHLQSMSTQMRNSSERIEATGSWQKTYPKEKTIEMRNKFLGPSLQLFYPDDPIKIVKGEYQYMYDENNVRYLDCINNVAHVGHSHPHVTAACIEQMSLLNTNCRYLHDNIVNLAERITKTLPDSLEICYFVNSGSEANDLAMRMSRYYTKSKETLVLDHAYHGHLISTTKISPYKFNKENCEEKKPNWVHVVPTPDSYRGKYRDTDYSTDQLADLYAEEVNKVCKRLKEEGKNIGMFYIESLQSCGGQVIFPGNYWEQVCNIVHNYGGLVIADEVQIGFGRVGESFWAFEIHENKKTPDIVVMGKSMGNGYPIAAVITNKSVAQAFRRGPDYFNTYGGNPVACAAGLAVLDVIENEQFQERANRVGKYVKALFQSMIDDLEIIGDVRGSGMFLGIDLVKDRKTREPATLEAKSVLMKLKERRIIMSRDGPYDNIIKFKPPMCFNEKDADFLVENLRIVLKEVQDEMRKAM